MTLEEVLATELLSERALRQDQLDVGMQVSDSAVPLSVAAACKQAMKASHAESAGISLFSDPQYDELTWLATSGHLARFQGRRFPHRHSMCGVCFARGGPQLFVRPHLYFQWLQQAGIGIREALVVPLKNLSGQFHGTLWVTTHSKEHVRFNQGDVNALEHIAAGLSFTGFTGSAGGPSRGTGGNPRTA